MDAETDDIVIEFMGKTMFPDPTCQADCSVCMENQAGNMCSLQCEHSFCYPCITNWVFTNPTCPLCRKNISRDIKEFR